MARNSINSARKAAKPGIKTKNLTDPAEIVHIENPSVQGRTLCGLKLGYVTYEQPDCVVCLDILEFRQRS
jgi:hypothetical protein